MRHTLRTCALVAALLLSGWIASGTAWAMDEYTEADLDSMTIEMAPGSGRPYLFSGTGETFFYGSTRELTEEGWMGYYLADRKLLDDFVVTIDGQPLNRNEASVTVKPYQVQFHWQSGVELTVSALGVLRTELMFNLTGVADSSQLAFFGVFPSGAEVRPLKNVSRMHAQVFMIAAGGDTTGLMFAGNEKYRMVEMQSRTEGGKLAGKRIFGAAWENSVRFDLVLVYGKSSRELNDRFKEVFSSNPGPLELRKQWLLDQLNANPLRTGNPRVDKALNWAKISLAMLTAEDESLIWAGLPWFSEGWARDTFISLPGAALVLGKYDMARNILLRFAQWQDSNPDSPTYGRVPNRARPGEIIYNTTDGTPWFVRELYEYGLYSGDFELWREMMTPGGVVERSIEGALINHVDEEGFLTHGDAETWMDAVGPDGPWSPRGNRAVEIQALWLTQLEAAVEMAHFVGEGGPDSTLVKKWSDLAERLRKELPDRYIRTDGLGLYDHINSDGSPDVNIRPNQLWAITVPLRPLFDEQVQRSIVSTVRDSLVYRWGVASLAQTDPDFHPWHADPHYPKDAAYHMGIVWTWLSGPYKSAASRLADSATPAVGYAVTDNECTQILEWGAAGTLSENLDALPRGDAKWPRTSGTVSQAWSLAELLRSSYQDVLGIRPLGLDGRVPLWSFDPHLPLLWGHVETELALGGKTLRVQMDVDDDALHATLTLLDAPEGGLLLVSPFSGPVVRLDGDTPTLSFSWPRSGDYGITVNGSEVIALTDARADEPMLQSHLAENLKAIRPPDYPLLDGPFISADLPDMKPVLELTDPEGDDRGESSGYGYPTHPAFQPGILDITGVTVKADESLVRFVLKFKNLSDPGWNPAYGYQLTFTTLAIKTGVRGRKKSREVGRNSGWRLSRREVADRFIHVGGGFEITDARGNILAAHYPQGTGYEMGNVGEGTVSFTVPRDLIGGDPAKWKLTVLVGAQDDHGGAGIGEFRKVSEAGGTWEGSGGGEDMPNVYDIIRTR